VKTLAGTPLPPRRNNAVSYRTRAVIGFDAGDITILEDQPYPCRAGQALGRHFDRGRINLAPGQLRVVQHGVRRPCEFGEIAHQFALASPVVPPHALAATAEEARFEETRAIHVAVKDARR
jgi:hypothetical protein